MQKITKETIESYKEHLENEEKASATTEKYIRDISAFASWLGGDIPDKQSVLKYKEHLRHSYSIASVNSVISSLNSFFKFCGLYKLCVKTIKVQRQIFSSREKELTKTEYAKLLKAASDAGNERLCLVMQTICSCGIRVSELKYITVDAIRSETAQIQCKGKVRCVFLPKDLCRILLKYTKKNNIKSGSVFVTRTGRPLDRSNIWSDMKKLCETAGVSKDKVFPHNLRHLFARTFYSVQKDIVRLADILGHSSVNTTRIYTMESGEVHRMQIQKLGLLHILI